MLGNCHYLFFNPGRSWNQQHLQRVSQGLLALLLSLKKRPVIRYEAGSEACSRLAERVRDLVRREAVLFDNNVPFNGDLPAPQLLIVDRRDDPVTPLLNQASMIFYKRPMFSYIDNF